MHKETVVDRRNRLGAISKRAEGLPPLDVCLHKFEFVYHAAVPTPTSEQRPIARNANRGQGRGGVHLMELDNHLHLKSVLQRGLPAGPSKKNRMFM